MFSKNINMLLVLTVFTVVSGIGAVNAADTNALSVDAASLPINAAQQNGDKNTSSADKSAGALVSPSKPQVAETASAKPNTQAGAPTPAPAPVSAQVPNSSKANPVPAPAAAVAAETPATTAQDDFNFDLKMKSINAPKAVSNAAESTNRNVSGKQAISDSDLPKDIQYKANPVENLGNSVLSQMDSDLFAQMSEIEKSTTLLTLELRREKIRNEIEAQKAIRQKNADDLERQKAEAALKDLEKKKQIEAKVLQERQLLIDKEKVFEVLKQRKLLNAYMNQMLLNEQEWLKEKESLYAQLAAAEQEKKELIELFKERIDKVLEASAKNIQAAEAARANFERIVKGLKGRNEQLRKRIEADAKIIKNAKSNLYIKSQSIEELKDKNAALGLAAANATANAEISSSEEEEEEVVETPKKLSAQYAILGISGRSGVMSVEVIDKDGQPLALKVGSPLPTGHVVSEIGADYVKFSRDGADDYLYVGRTIDGIIPEINLLTTKEKNKK